MMLPEMERRIRDIFQTEHFLSTGYTSNETGAIGFQCRHLPPSHFHVHENMQHVSINLPSLSSDQELATGGQKYKE
jgi:phenylacetate-CoA ligase